MASTDHVIALDFRSATRRLSRSVQTSTIGGLGQLNAASSDRPDLVGLSGQSSAAFCRSVGCARTIRYAAIAAARRLPGTTATCAA